MADRAPLAGWRGLDFTVKWGAMCLSVEDPPGGDCGLEWSVEGQYVVYDYVHGGGVVTAQLAAEDAARALVAEMAAALGGRVVWNESEVTP